MTDAIVVGAGPNGLAAAVVLARAGLSVVVLEAAAEIGGGTHTSEHAISGVLHDECSAVHPLGPASEFLNSLGVQWCYPEVDLAHPLDSGAAGVMLKSLDETIQLLDRDGAAWRRLFGPVVAGMDDLLGELARPILHVPKHPLRLAGFGLRALQPATLLARPFRTEEGRALFTGGAAHAFYPLTRPTSAAVGLMLLAAGHRWGWPVARGGSRAITDAMAAELRAHGGQIETNSRVTDLAELDARTVILDLTPRVVADLAGDRLPRHVARAYRRWRHGPAAYKVDFAVEGGVPWRNEYARRAGTLHLGGSAAEIVHAERETWQGRMPQRPFVLAAQQYLADPSRSAGDIHPFYTYAHVPHGFTGDATAAIIAQVERFAPGFRERILDTTVCTPAEFESANANYIGGDVITGANTMKQVALRPRLALDPYATGIPGVYLCSAATPPGAGAHGLCGINAAQSALRALRT